MWVKTLYLSVYTKVQRTKSSFCLACSLTSDILHSILSSRATTIFSAGSNLAATAMPAGWYMSWCRLIAIQLRRAIRPPESHWPPSQSDRLLRTTAIHRGHGRSCVSHMYDQSNQGWVGDLLCVQVVTRMYKKPLTSWEIIKPIHLQMSVSSLCAAIQLFKTWWRVFEQSTYIWKTELPPSSEC